MENFKIKILNHNNKTLDKLPFKKKEKTCNYKAEPCALNKTCLASNLVYKTTLKTYSTTKNYIGSTSTTFKDIYRNRKVSFNNKHKIYST